ncbi:MAG TPA: class I SAM-dependent methyltransferase [Acidimicrobiales bacterium]
MEDLAGRVGVQLTARPDGPSSPARHHWFEDVADHLGEAYLRYSFTKGTTQEVAFLVSTLGLSPGSLVADVGCGPGRHTLGLAERGITTIGVDISERFVRLGASAAGPGAVFVRGDACRLPLRSAADAVISVCQGGFGLLGLDGADGTALAEMTSALRPGGGLVCTAFSAYFQVRYLEESDTFDVDAGVNHERTSVRSPHGVDMTADLWTTCFTPRELRLMAAAAGLEVDHIWGGTPGAYSPRAPTLDDPELILVAHRPG